MNRQIIRIACMVAACLVSGWLFTACDASLPVADDASHDELIIRLALPAPLEVTTKADGMFNDLTINDVWVLQYAKETDALLKAGKYSGNNIGAENKGVIAVKTSGFMGVDSYFYVIANGGDDFLALNDTLIGGKTPITVADLKQKTKKFGDNYVAAPTFATADSIVLTSADIKDKDGKAILVAPLQRAFARVNVKWNKTSPFSGNLTITDVKVCNVPKVMAAYARGGGAISDKYPEINPDNIKDAITIGSLGAGSTQTFYMPENLRGMGTGRTLAEKNMPEKGPGGNLDGCTFILMSGEYKYNDSHPNPIKVQYKIYLGGNLTNDYNIQRGYSYDLNVNISGANSADVRVTITDGRVVVFDDVVVMETVNVDF